MARRKYTKRLALLTGCCVLVTGHPGHNGERRFRGSSMWRGRLPGGPDAVTQAVQVLVERDQAEAPHTGTKYPQ